MLPLNGTVADIVRSDYRTADVFKKHQINFCCSGMVSLKDACDARQLNVDSVVADLREATRNIRISNTVRFENWKPGFLVDYITNVHHAYLTEAFPLMEARLLSFMEGHKKKYPELVGIYAIFIELSQNLLTHNRYEEEIIFPYIKQIESVLMRNESYGNLFVRTLRKPLSNVEKEHKLINDLLEKMRLVTNNYTFPEKACTNHQVVYHKLKEIDDDFSLHSYLEHDILFPKAIEIEQKLLSI